MALVSSSDSVRIGIVFVALFAYTLAAPTAADDHWWYRPCETDPSRIRHGRSATDPLVAVKRQLRIVNQQISISIHKINALYKDHEQGVTKPYGKLTWLKIGKMHKSLKKAPNMLQEFGKSLQYFAGTIQVLVEREIQTTATQFFDKEKRKSIYNNITYHMRNLLCEVQESAGSLKNVSLQQMKIQKHLPRTLDLTGAHILDLNFFKKTKNFLNRSQKLFTNKKKAKKSIKSAVKRKRT